uniref:Retrotransposon Copia-like N-terminal domain-containing protein n=1 Tax=Tanacetum cinerariifolium TaxID=118510 RepID=A0A6L2KD67_TANCI|nr:hypothetical protein [Tanacetum cinerariifolium]
MADDDMPKKGVSSSSSDLNLTFSDRIYLHPNDTGSIPIVTIKLTGTENYKVWSIAMTYALRNHNKIGFIDGSCEKDNTNTTLANQWDMCNSVVFTWILNSLSSDLYVGAIYAKSASELWNDLKDTYDKVDGSAVFNLHKSINSLNQSGASLVDYYNNLNSLWKQFDAMVSLPACTLVKNLIEILLLLELLNPLQLLLQPRLLITTRFFELVGYPAGYVKRNFNPKSVSSNNTSADIHSNNASSNSASNSPVSLSNEQLARLTNLLNDNGVSTANAIWQDLKANKTVGIGKQFNGLYLFNFDNAFYFINRIPSSVLFGKSPYFYVYGHDPSLSYFKGYKLLSLENKSIFYSRDIKFYETVFPFKMKSKLKQTEFDSGVTKDLNQKNFFENENPKRPNDEGRVSSNNDETELSPDIQGNGNSKSISMDEKNNIHPEGTVPNETDFVNDFYENSEFNSEVEELLVNTVRRSTRQTKLPTNLNDFIIEGKVKYGVEKVVNYANLNHESFCFASGLNKSIEPTCYEEAILDNNWIDAMNTEIEALNKNHT